MVLNSNHGQRSDCDCNSKIAGRRRYYVTNSCRHGMNELAIQGKLSTMRVFQ